MDPFQIVPRENERARMRDNWSPDRGELRQVLTRLRDRYGRRRVFRVADVEAVVMELRYPDLFPERLAPPTPVRVAPRTILRPARVDPAPVVDLACDEVLGST